MPIVLVRRATPLSTGAPAAVFAALFATLFAATAWAAQPQPFSAGPVGGAPPGWTVVTPPKAEQPTRFDLFFDATLTPARSPASAKRGGKGKADAEQGRDRSGAMAGTIVLRARSKASSASLRHALYADPLRTPLLGWRWRTERVLHTADLTGKKGEDFAARVCVYFDRKPEELTVKQRSVLKLQRNRYGELKVPTAALCYVWDNRQPVETLHDSAAPGFVKLLVVTSGAGRQGDWLSLRRDVAVDYRRAFGSEPPQITAISVAADTDDTGESTTSYFGDLRFAAGRLTDAADDGRIGTDFPL